MAEYYLFAKYTQFSIIGFMYSSDDRSEVVFEIRLMPPLLSLSVLFYGFLMSGHVEMRWRGSPRIRVLDSGWVVELNRIQILVLLF